MKVHTGDKPYDCPYCGKLFKTNSHLKLHVCIHTGAKLHSCRHCSQRFTQLNHLNRHLLKSHNEGTWLTCNICQKKFNASGNLKQHLLRHERVKPYVCSQCAKCFCTVHDLKSHQLVHSDYKQFCWPSGLNAAPDRPKTSPGRVRDGAREGGNLTLTINAGNHSELGGMDAFHYVTISTAVISKALRRTACGFPV